MKQTIQLPWLRLMLALISTGSGLSIEAGLLNNPSFEANYTDSFPHYGPINGWAGGSGVNQSDGPFHNDATPVPDLGRVAFLQGSVTLSQDVNGISPGERYWIQFFYDARACCGGTIDLSTLVNDAPLDQIANVQPVTGGKPYIFRNVPFIPPADHITLKFQTVADGDATALVDGVCLVKRNEGNVVVMNPGFEASGDLPDTGLTPAGQFLAGWEAAGTFGVANSSQPAADNGTIPEQNHVGFLQGEGSSFRQLLAGLVPNTRYTLGFACNARQGAAPRLQVMVGTDVVLTEDITPIGGANTYSTKSVRFTASTTNEWISFTQTAVGNQTLTLDDIQVFGTAALVRNPSFESTKAPSDIGEGPVPAWDSTGIVGLNTADQPFADNGQIPDRAQVAFIQGNGSLSQQIFGLRAGRNYWLQFRYNGRNCCPAGSTTELSVRFDGQLLGNVTVTAVLGQNPYHSASFNLMPARSSGRLEFIATTPNDATLLLDAITLVERASDEIVVINPSFEASGVPEGVGYLQPARISGWETGDGFGVNVDRAGPFTDNGVAGAQDLVLFLQNNGSFASQVLSGFVPNQSYTLTYKVNGRGCCSPGPTLYSVALGDHLLLEEEIAPVGPGVPFYNRNIVFSATSESTTLKFQHTSDNGDHTLLLDDVRIMPGEVVSEYHNDFATTFGGSGLLGSAEWRPNGGVASSGFIRLTPAITNATGALLLPQLLGGEPVAAFTASFSLQAQLSKPPADYFEGFTFSLSPDGPVFPEDSSSTGLAINLRTFQDECGEGSMAQIRYSDEMGSYFFERRLDRTVFNTGTNFATVGVTVSEGGKLTLTWSNGGGPSLIIFSNLTCYLPTVGRFAFAARNSDASSSFGIDNVRIETQPVEGTYVSVHAPMGERPAGSEAGLEVHIEHHQAAVEPASVRLLVDGRLVVDGSEDLTTVTPETHDNPAKAYTRITYDRAKYGEPDYRPWPPGSEHVVKLRYREVGSATERLSEWSFTVDRMTPEVFVIEAEDFNFGGGNHMAAASSNSYGGGGYQNLPGKPGVDLILSDPSSGNAYGRTNPSPDIRIALCDNERGEQWSWHPGDAIDWSRNTNDFTVGVRASGDWFNYTRNFPTNSALGRWNVYVRANSISPTALLRLEEVTAGSTTVNQSVRVLGTFAVTNLPAAGMMEFFPLVDPVTLDPKIVTLAGPHTVRMTLLEGECNVNYLVFTTPRRELHEVHLAEGISLLATPYSLGSNTLNELLVGLPEGTHFFKYDAAGAGTRGFQGSTYLHDLKWLPNQTAPPGTGFFLVTPRSVDFLFEGYPLTGEQQTPIAAGFNLLGSPQPVAGLITEELSFPAVDGQQAFLWNGIGYTAFDYFAGDGWFEGGEPSEPSISVGQGFWVWTSTATIWRQPPLQGLDDFNPPLARAPFPGRSDSDRQRSLNNSPLGLDSRLLPPPLTQWRSRKVTSNGLTEAGGLVDFSNAVLKASDGHLDSFVEVGPPLYLPGVANEQFVADLWSGADPGSLAQVSTVTASARLPSNVLTGGRIARNSSHPVEFPSFPGTETLVQIRSWPVNRTYADASGDPTAVVFVSNIFSVTPARSGEPPPLPAIMYGLTNFFVRPPLLSNVPPSRATFGDPPLVLPIALPVVPPVQVNVIDGPGEVSSDRRLKVNGAGTILVEVSRPGDGVSYLPASNRFSINVARFADSIPPLGLPDLVHVGAAIPLTSFTAASGRNLNFSIEGTAAAIEGGTLKFLTPGTVTLRVTAAEDNNYTGASTSALITIIQPRFTSLGFTSQGQLELKIDVVPGSQVTVQWSADLIHWNSLPIVTAQSRGVTIIDPAADTMRYYRAIIP